MSGALERRLTALAEAVRLADGRLPLDVVEAAASVVRRAGERLGHGLDATVVALAGPTGAGKSTLFNALAGRDLVATGVRRPTTSAPTAAVRGAPDARLLDWLEVPSRHVVDDGPEGLVLLDLPDFDSVEVSHRLEVDRLVRLVDLLVWVVDPQKYADAVLHERYLQPLARHAGAMLVVLNQADRLGGEVGRARDDVRRLLAEGGLGDVPVLAASARTGEGLDELRAALEVRVRAREAALERLSAAVDEAAARMRALLADEEAPGVDVRDRARLVAALGEAAGLPAVVRAVAGAHRRRGSIATGLPWSGVVRRLRPDPLRRLRIGDTPREDVRTSLPQATPVQRAQVESAVRTLAADATAGLGEPWPSLARRAAIARQDELADRLARAIAGTRLGLRPPRWWTPVRWLQRALAAASAAGALWLLALAAIGWLRLDEVVPTPEVRGIAVPTLLLLGGLLAGVFLAFGARRANGVGARRRARRARKALHERVAGVADELVLDPISAELQAAVALREALEAAVGNQRRRSSSSDERWRFERPRATAGA